MNFKYELFDINQKYILERMIKPSNIMIFDGFFENIESYLNYIDVSHQPNATITLSIVSLGDFITTT